MHNSASSILQIPKDRVETATSLFWSKVVKTNSCWYWNGAKNQAGYGQVVVSLHSKNIHFSAHRFSYELINGAMPNELTLDHLCRNPACVNPSHLEVVSMRANILRGNGRAAQQARQTYCKRGHLLAGNNLCPYALRLGQRICITCRNLKQRERYWRRKSQSIEESEK